MRFSDIYTFRYLIKNAATFTPDYNENYRGLVDDLAKMRPENVHKQLIPNGVEVRIPFNFAPTNESFLENEQEIPKKDRDTVNELQKDESIKKINYLDGNLVQEVKKADGSIIMSNKPIGKYFSDGIKNNLNKARAVWPSIKAELVKINNSLGGAFEKNFAPKSDPSLQAAGKAFPQWLEENKENNFALDQLDNNLLYHMEEFEPVRKRLKNEYLTFIDDVKKKEVALKGYNESDVRKRKIGPSNLEVVITSDPHDIAQMSTYKSWESCLQLGKGAYQESVFCSVAGGDVIALLTEKGINLNEGDVPQSGIKDKIMGRILIRNFTNKAGKSIFVPEDKVYGSEGMKDAFKKAVKDYIVSVQGVIPNASEVTPDKYSMPSKEVKYEGRVDKDTQNLIDKYKMMMGLLKQCATNPNDEKVVSELTDRIMTACKGITLMMEQQKKDHEPSYGVFLNLGRFIKDVADNHKMPYTYSAEETAEKAMKHNIGMFQSALAWYSEHKQQEDIAKISSAAKFQGYSDTFPINNFESKQSRCLV